MKNEHDPGSEPAGSQPERIVLFGSEGGFTLPLLTRLLAQHTNIVAVLLPGVAPTEPPVSEIPVSVRQQGNPGELARLTDKYRIPLLRTRNFQEQHLPDDLSALQADIFLVACFPFKIPDSIRNLPALACWNIHPSLLPRYRGPNPLYWQLQNREKDTGVTLHEVSGQLDAGDILAQQSAPLPDEPDDTTLNQWVVELGVELFIQAVELRRRGKLIPIQQDESIASYFPPA